MNRARDLACGHVRAALGLERAGVAVEFAGAVNDRAVLSDIRSQRREQAAAFAKLLPAGAYIEVSWPPTIPSFMQRPTTVSNSLRRRSLSRKRPWRFLENVE